MQQKNKTHFQKADASMTQHPKSRLRTWWSVALVAVLVTQAMLAAGSASASTYEWAAAFSGNDNGAGKGIALDSSGNVYSTGYFQNQFDFNPGAGTNTATILGQRDIFISKLDNDGNFVSVKSLGGGSIDEARAIELDATGNIYIVGDFRSTVDFDPIGNAAGSELTSAGDYDMFVTKRDPAGDFIWSKNFGSTSIDQGWDVAVGPDLRVYSTGQFSGTVNFDPAGDPTWAQISSGYDPFVSALNSDGTVSWANFVKGPANERANGVAVDSNNNVFVVGYYSGQNTDFNPKGTPSIPTYAGVRDIFVAKYNTSGTFQWARTIGGNGNDYASGVTVDATGNVYVTGTFVGSVDFDPGAGIFTLTSASPSAKDIFTAKFDNDGNLVWAKRAGGSSIDEGFHVKTDSSGNVVTTGYFSGTVDFDPGAGEVLLTSAGGQDIFVWALDANGDYVDAAAMGGPSNDIGYGVTVDDAGNVYTTGSFEGKADFDPSPSVANEKTSAGGTDIFVSKLTFFSSTPNTPPVANSDAYTTTQNTVLNGISVLANDTDAEQPASALTASLVSDVSNGSLSLNSDGTFVYTPTNGFAGPDAFVYEVSDGVGGTAQATAMINITNIPPVANGNSYEVVSGVMLTGNVTGNDSDVAGDALSVSLVTNVMSGTLTLNSTGSFTYTSNVDVAGTDSFVYELSDSYGGTDQATVTITVSAVTSNVPPVANSEVYTVSIGNMITGNVLANDTDADDDPLTASEVSAPSQGTLVLNSNGTFTYTPNADATGQDSFEYQASDGKGGTANATVTINISAIPVNNAPNAVNDTASTDEDVVLNGTSVLDNDSDPDSNEMVVETTPVSGPTNGTLQLNSDGTYVYTPTANFNGTDSFVYRVCDDGTPASACDEATVTITVTAVNDEPTANDDTFVVATNSADNVLNVLINDSFAPDTGETLSITAVGTPNAGGSASIDGTTIKYTPAADYVGTETFTYTISDGNGGTSTATVTITVNGVTGSDGVKVFIPLAYR